MGFWRVLWEEDLQASVRDVINQVFYLVVTVLLQFFGKLLDVSNVAHWVAELIHEVFDGLTVVALGTLAIPMALRMIRSAVRSVKQKHDE